MDRRERNHKWYQDFDQKTMMFTVEDDNGEEIEIPAEYDVCGTCDGRGSHVNPSIDAHGISPEEFAEDPEFIDGNDLSQFEGGNPEDIDTAIEDDLYEFWMEGRP